MQRLLIDDYNSIPSDIRTGLLEECEEMIYRLPVASKRPKEAKDMRFYAVIEDPEKDDFALLSVSMNWLNASQSPHQGGFWSGRSFYSHAEECFYHLAMLWW